MFNNLVKLLIFIFILSFFITVFNFYFSEKNINLLKKNRNNIEIKLSENISNLPVLENDTNYIIEFNSGFNNTNKNSFKRNFWELLK
tara:strand:- start:481 stop:741 length:261 start_codon:yes stop_codon:yes gene_type:complete